MNKEAIIVLPWLECLNRSFGYFLINLKTVLAIVVLGLLVVAYEALTETPLFCSMAQIENCTAAPSAYMGVVALTTLFSAYVMVAFARFVILKDRPRPFAFRFGVRELKVLGYQLAIDVIPWRYLRTNLGAMVFYMGRHQVFGQNNCFCW